jgi:membrane fusion protein (multidrug efflux system)
MGRSRRHRLSRSSNALFQVDALISGPEAHLRFIKAHPVFIVILLATVGIAGLTGNTYLARKQQSSNFGFGAAPVVITAFVKRATLIDSIESIGTTMANESVSLTSKVTDTVRTVNFEDGEYAQVGAILVELTNAEETAMLAEARATLNEAKRQLVRVQGLIDQNLASELQLDEVLARQQTANARLEAVMARLDDRLIRAPFSGVLGYRNVSPGTLLSPNTAVTTLDDISLIKLDFTIPEQYLALVARGQKITARSVAYPELEFSGQVNTINSRVDPVTRAVRIRAHIANDERLLRSGMLLTVVLRRNTVEALVIPEEAIVPVQSKHFVYSVGDDDTVQRVAIETGRRRPGIVEVLSGLTLGQEVVAEGVIKVRPGIKIVRKEVPTTPKVSS